MIDIDLKRLNIFPTLARNSPIYILIYTFINAFMNPSYNTFYFLIIMLLLFPINWMTKHLLMKPIYNLFKKDKLPLLGLGPRPANASNCDIKLTFELSTSFGMPSGHSQLIWTFGTYIACKTYDTWITKKNTYNSHLYILSYLWVILALLINLSVMLYISYSRVYIEKCHTLQQVIVGGLIGCVTGFLMFYYEYNIINKIN